ncbi:MAG: methylated-DNA--protein-cysteine S-methyltransferase protein [Armatimonadetes bacterium]|jgi:methylated-DNA-[protein]-cysteine S-methyltransferase|nr:methylated-DNA--protein-cysteine S-methyltransferase protein [Armatimonadota bacterium]
MSRRHPALKDVDFRMKRDPVDLNQTPSGSRGRSGLMTYALVDTPLGPCGLAWSGRGLARLQLPEADREATEARLLRSALGATPADPPAHIQDVVAELLRYLDGARTDFAQVRLDLAGVSPFYRVVYEATRTIGWGQTATYGELARLAHSPGAPRAVGQAMSRNPIPIIIPCHRILASGAGTGGFSAFGGVTTKARLLALEGVDLLASRTGQRALTFG